jgi:poly(glycerol-phosphate) alpha-glucosyltransferase
MDVLHTHMLWDYPVYAAWKVAKLRKLPLIISPHGSLNNEWRYSGVMKTIYRKLILDRIFSDTTCIHVLNKEEELACRNYGIKCPIRIIPNGLPLDVFDSFKDPSLAFEMWPELLGRRILLYFGRLWHGKGLDILPDAWAQVAQVAKKNNWLLVIAGPDYCDYRVSLEKKIQELDLGSSILLTGPVYGNAKESLMAAATLYVLPSHGEGFSMALLEAVAAKRPALFTDKCNFTELATCGGGWEVADITESLVESLRTLLEMNDDYFDDAGLAGWRYARERYSLEVVASQLVDMYKAALK